MKIARLIATVFYVGYLRPAPGTWGSLVALPMAWALHTLGGPLLFVIAIIAGSLKGLWATAKVTEGQADHDPSEVVIDEVSFGAWQAGVDILALWPGWIVAFLTFRAFDIFKPGPVGTADRRGDALGVMLDDMLAGAFAAIFVVVLAGFAHLVLM